MKKSLIIGICIGLIIITCLVLFIIGLRLYIINKDTDKDKYIKKENTAILLMSLSVVVLIVIIMFYISYKFGDNIFKGLQFIQF